MILVFYSLAFIAQRPAGRRRFHVSGLVSHPIYDSLLAPLHVVEAGAAQGPAAGDVGAWARAYDAGWHLFVRMDSSGVAVTPWMVLDISMDDACQHVTHDGDLSMGLGTHGEVSRHVSFF